jgi:hypothetical protein
MARRAATCRAGATRTVSARLIGHAVLPDASTGTTESDPLIAALARYVEALHRRYPEGPEQMRREGLDGRANITGMDSPKKDTAA